MFFNNRNLKTIVFPLIFGFLWKIQLDFYEKSKKPLGNTMVLYYQIRKIQIFPFFVVFIKIQKTMKIKKSKNPNKTFKDVPKSFGFLCFSFFGFL